MESERNRKDGAIEVDKIRPDPKQPREHFDEKGIEELAESIDRQGLLERILIRPVGGNEYMIVHGERRYRACRKLGWKEIPCRVKDLNEEETRDAQLVENLQRNNLSDMELAWDFEKRVERGQTQDEIAERIGKSRSFVAKRLSLLKLSEKEQSGR